MGQWKKGQSGNPGGRPKGFGELIRQATRDGEEMVEFALAVMRGELSITQYTKLGIPYEAPPSFRERIEALKWLGDRGFGKALQVVLPIGTADEGEDLNGWSVEELRQFARERAKEQLHAASSEEPH